MKFSSLHRAELIERLKNESFDLLVMGGGITGVGIALDATTRGLRVALIEKYDFAFGTSSRSTKLIHGGLRYLKQLEFGLVKEVGSERAVVHRIAPHLVIPEKMLLPLHEKKGLGYGLTSIGLKIYDLLAGVKTQDRRRMLTREQTLQAEPLLRQDDIKGGALYAEYRTDDARLTIEIAKAAHRHGATLINYLGASGFELEQNQVRRVKATDQFTGETLFINAKAIVNAAGPWVDEIRSMNNSLKGKRLHLSKGVHIVVSRERFPVKQSIYFDGQDGRMIFAIPRGRITYVGTTDTSYYDSREDVNANREDAEYILNAVNVMFPSINLGLNDIESSWAGLRPLIHQDGKEAAALSRKEEIFVSETGLFSIAGGKLTGYRKMGERVVDMVIRKHFQDRNLLPCTTDRILLPGAPQKYQDLEILRKKIDTILRKEGLTEHWGVILSEAFGEQSLLILETMVKLKENYSVEEALILAQVDFCIRYEMVSSLCDFFIRRTGTLYFDIQKVGQYMHAVSKAFQQEFGWNEERLAKELANVKQNMDTAEIKRQEKNLYLS